jgi:hypothetical protein
MEYTSRECATFAAEAEAAGYEVEDYDGRSYWHGPAVRAESRPEFIEIIRATTVPVQWDSLGMGWIVYPVASEPRQGL